MKPTPSECVRGLTKALKSKTFPPHLKVLVRKRIKELRPLVLKELAHKKKKRPPSLLDWIFTEWKEYQ